MVLKASSKIEKKIMNTWSIVKGTKGQKNSTEEMKGESKSNKIGKYIVYHDSFKL